LRHSLIRCAKGKPTWPKTSAPLPLPTKASSRSPTSSVLSSSEVLTSSSSHLR
jgi:hypothetical protein